MKVTLVKQQSQSLYSA